MKAKNPLSTLCQTDTPKIIDAAVNANFLQLMVTNEKLAYESLLKTIYKTDLSKETMGNYLKTLKRFWEPNKVELTGQILELEASYKAAQNIKTVLSLDQSDFEKFQSNNPQQIYKHAEIPNNNSSCYLDSSDDNYDISKNKSIFEKKTMNAKDFELQRLSPVPKTKTWPVSKLMADKVCELKNQKKRLEGWSDLLIDDYISTHNPHCVLIFKSSHAKKENSNKKNLPLFRARAFCKHSTCKTLHVFTINKK